MFMSFLFISLGMAIPQQFSQQGRILDSDGYVVEGTHAISFRIFNTEIGGNPLWEEVLIEDLLEGYFSVILGANTLNPIDDILLQSGPLYLEIEVGNDGALSPRKQVLTSPYARLSEVSQKLDGGSVNATEIQINGTMIIDNSGSWIGPTISLNWQDIQSVPSDILDGDNDTLMTISCSQGEILGWNNGWACTSDASLSEQDVEGFITNEPLELASGTTMDGSVLTTELSDRDSFSDLGFSCQTGDIPKWDGSEWQCDIDINDFSDLQNIPAGLLDGDNVLSEQDVENYIINDALSLSADTTLNGEELVAISGCTSGQVLYNDNGNWVCKDFLSLLDNDSDGFLAWNDCDDDDSSVLSNADDADCDGYTSSDDCDNNDPDSLTTDVDGDCDGVLTADDCNDNNPSSTVKSTDTDCDGIVNENDLDADGDDTCDATGTLITDDADCDGVLTADDCDDSNADVVFPGIDINCPGESCTSILNSNSSATDGEYWLQGSGDPYQVWCDMTNAGGGWTLVIKGTMNTSYNGSKNATLSDNNGFLSSFDEVEFNDVMVKFGDYESTSDWVTYSSVGNGSSSLDNSIKNCCSGSFDVDYNIAAPHSSSTRSTSLSGVSEVNNLSFRMSQTAGPNDALFFVVTDSQCTSSSSNRTVSADCVGAMLGFGASNYSWDTWETVSWDTTCGTSGYRDGSNTNCTQQGGIFVR
jgi:hypothetical protein